MAITTRPDTADRFIDGAHTTPGTASPVDADGERPKRVRKGNKVQISVTIDEDLLDQLTALAATIGISRAALMTIACKEAVTNGIALPHGES